jgi:hypothetical protein
MTSGSDGAGGLELATCSYKEFRPADGVPVRTSNGAPRWRLPYRIEHVCRPLIPEWASVKAKVPLDVFEVRYRACLDTIGVDAIAEALTAIADQAGDHRLVLLCFDDVAQLGDQACHRRMFARWWTEQTGLDVPELSTDRH